MKLRKLMLGTAALAGTLLFAAPGFAEPNYYNTNPTAEERAQTDRLNAGAAARAHSDADANAANQDNYNADQARFERDSHAAEADRARYDRDRARYDDQRAGGAHRWDAFYGYNRFRDILTVPSRDLIGMRVSTRGGDRVGRISDVDTNHAGRITRVAVGVRGGNTAWIDTDDLRYDPGTRAVLTDLTRDQVNSMARMRYPRF